MQGDLNIFVLDSFVVTPSTPVNKRWYFVIWEETATKRFMIGSSSFLGALCSSPFLSSVFSSVGALGAPSSPPRGLYVLKNGL